MKLSVSLQESTNL